MAHIPWKERYRTGIAEIDDQHLALLAILNEVVDMATEAAPAEEAATILHRLCEYALTHFNLEESLMTQASYEGLEHHQQEHAAFIARVLDFNQRYAPDDPAFLDAIHVFLRGWYAHHILEVDLRYVPTLRQAGLARS